MNGLAKQANMMRNIKKRVEQEGMTPEQFEEFTGNLKNEYNLDTDYLYHPKANLPGLSYAVPDPKEVQKIRNNPLRRLLSGAKGYQGTGSTLVNTVPLEDIVLHETGHIADPDILERIKKARRWGMMGGVSGLGATLGVPNLPDSVPNKVKTALGVGLSGLAGLGAGKSSQYVNQSEDAANKFVKQHWAKEVGEELAEKKFQESFLPIGRKSYGHAGLKGLKQGLVTGIGTLATLASKGKLK